MENSSIPVEGIYMYVLYKYKCNVLSVGTGRRGRVNACALEIMVGELKRQNGAKLRPGGRERKWVSC